MEITWIIAGVAVVGLLVWAWIAQRRKFADEYFVGLTPGLSPVGGQPENRVPVPGGVEYNGEVAVAFNPPKGVAPGMAGTVVDGKPETRDVIATIVDLAARGHLSIVVVESTRARNGRDWELRVADRPPADSLDPGERQLLHDLFVGGPEVRLANLPREGNPAINDYQYRLADQSYQQGWFRNVGGLHPVRIVWIAAAVMLLIGFAAGLTPLLVAGGVAAVGGVLIGAQTAQRPVRTAEGTALRIQTLGFKKYLETAEKEQFKYEEASEIFSKYLPWAIVLGVAAHWVKVFGDLAAQAREDGYEDDFDLVWLGVMGWGVADMAIGLSMFAGGMDLGGMADGGLGDAFGDPGAMFDSGAIEGVGADATGADLGGFDGASIGSDSGGWGDFGGGDFGGFGGGDFGGGGD